VQVGSFIDWASTTRYFNVPNTFKTDGVQGVAPGQTYSLVLSLQRQPTNPDFVSLEHKTITVIDGPGKGQHTTIKSYDPETRAYTTDGALTGIDAGSKFEISQSMYFLMEEVGNKVYW